MAGADWVATYRLQLHAGFGFAQAQARLPYLKQLGISHLYLSPILEAAQGSSHGYDVIDPTRVSSQLGGRVAFDKLVDAVKAEGMGLLLDIVPNHMSIADPRNRWWWDVLENGQSGSFAHVFDVDWHPPEKRNESTVVLPVLGDHRAKVIARGELKLSRGDGGSGAGEGAQFLIRYYDQRFPVAAHSLASVLDDAGRRCDAKRLGFLADAFRALPSPSALDLESVARRQRDQAVLYEMLAELQARDVAVKEAIDQAIEALNANPERLDSFLDDQPHRLAYWRTGQRELDYRRFFDISSLVALRMEDPRVFKATHAFLEQLHGRGVFDGLRIDHVDGLANPRVYLERVKAMAPGARVYVEKILGTNEALPAWPVEGTTGYEFAAQLVRLSADPRAKEPLTALTAELLGEPVPPFEDLAHATRKFVLANSLAADVQRLTERVTELRNFHRDARDFSRHDLKEGLLAILASFPVYRTYVEPEHGRVSQDDVKVIDEAIAAAKQRAPHLEAELFEFLKDVLTLKRKGPGESDFVRRFQQLSSPAMAKGLEDTAFYRYPRLLALNEVGSDPAWPELDVAAFHAANAEAQARWPHRLLGSSTHDTKRSEDVRARLVAASHRAKDFAALAKKFFEQVEPLRKGVLDGGIVLTTLQTLVGAWPVSPERLKPALQKSAREAKVQTSWERPNPEYEKALDEFVMGLQTREVAELISGFVDGLEKGARTLSLGWTLLKCTSPGVPDFYQGTERWRHDLVDPDNRGPVDWEKYERSLTDALSPVPLEQDGDGANKQFVIRKSLQVRRELPEVFGAHSTYEPTALEGASKDRAVAFRRFARDGQSVLAVAPRFPPEGRDPWAEIQLPLPAGRAWTCAFTGEKYEGTVPLQRLFAKLPVCLLR